MIDLTYQTGDSILHRMNPTHKFLGLLLCTIIILVSKNLAGTIIAAVLITTLILLSKLPIKKVFAPLKSLFFFLIMIFLMNALFFNSGNCLYSYHSICISYKGIEQGYNIVLHTIAITILSSIFIRTTTSIEIMKGIENTLRPLRIFHVPTKDISLIMSIALQFIPVFFNDIDRIRKAQIARGANFNKGSIIARIQSIFPLVIPAFISAFRRADELSTAIEARGFQSDYESFK